MRLAVRQLRLAGAIPSAIGSPTLWCTELHGTEQMTSWSRVAYCFGIGLCIQGGIWLLWPHPHTRIAALIALLLLSIGIIVTHRGVPVRFTMVSLHLQLQAAWLGFALGHQLFDVYPASPIWASAFSNVITGIVAAVMLGLLGTVVLGVTRWVGHIRLSGPSP